MHARSIRRPVVWSVGQTTEGFEQQLAARGLLAAVVLRTFDDLSQAERRLAVDRNEADTRESGEPIAPPELLLVWQTRPGEVTDAQLARLRTLAPLVRLWRVLDSWCEGEARSGRPPAGCSNSYRHSFLPDFERELRAIAAGGAPSWQFPATANGDERQLASPVAGRQAQAGLIVVVAGRASNAQALVDVFQSAGYQTLVASPEARWQASQAAAVAWDTDCGQLARHDQISRLRAQAGGAPLVALVGFPRPEDQEACRGLATVVAKPYRVETLLAAVEDAREALASHG